MAFNNQFVLKPQNNLGKNLIKFDNRSRIVVISSEIMITIIEVKTSIDVIIVVIFSLN